MKQVKQINWSESDIAVSADTDRKWIEIMESKDTVDSVEFRKLLKHMIRGLAWRYQRNALSELQYHAAMILPAQMAAIYLSENIDNLIEEINSET